jgi:hypothetical protein
MLSEYGVAHQQGVYPRESGESLQQHVLALPGGETAEHPDHRYPFES